MRFLVIIRPTNTGYSADVPDIPGCIAAAGSLRGVCKLMAEAMALHLDSMRRDGEDIPNPRHRFQLNADDFEEGDICTWLKVASPQEIRKLKKRKKTLSSK
jgi:predicted RNase H-like HicB family nuclease